MALPAEEALPAETPGGAKNDEDVLERDDDEWHDCDSGEELAKLEVDAPAKQLAELEVDAPAKPKTILQLMTNFVNADYSSYGRLLFPELEERKENLSVLTQRTSPGGELRPLKGAHEKIVRKAPNGWEIMSAVVDSGATVAVLHPEDGQAYKVEESEASRRGVEYEIANGDAIPNLGQKRMAVMTPEGTLRGYSSQVADVSRPLLAVRQQLATGHAVCFGLGENGEDHLIINRLTGEINRMRDDGVNYLQDFLVVPPDAVAQLAANTGQDFGRLG